MIKSGNKNEFFINDLDEQDLRDGKDFAQLKADCVSFIESKRAVTYAHLNREFANGYHLNLALVANKSNLVSIFILHTVNLIYTSD